VIVIGIGNDLRRDDGAGPAVIDELRRRGLDDMTLAVSDGEPARLIDLWAPADLAIVVDAVRSPAGQAGRVRRLDTIDDGRPAPSSHALGLIEATRLGEALDRMPARLRVYVIEGADFGYGPGLSPPVTRAVTEVADQITALRHAVDRCTSADQGGGEGPGR
jgi:hydrogenase maturation protease